ncbi:MAG: hypothetical protein ACON4K_11880 [Akkermansiaceae bacterium]
MHRLISHLIGLAVTLFALSTLHGIDLVENFEGDAIDSAVWDTGGAKTLTVADGRLTVGDGGGNWANGNIRSQQRFFLPEAGETTSIEWVLGSATSSAEAAAGQTVRTQIGIISANQTGDNPEHYPNNTGGVWIDLDSFLNADLTSVGGVIFVANKDKPANQNADNYGTVVPAWDWKTGTATYRLDLTDTGFSWFENGTEVSVVNWTDFGLDTEFDNGFRVIALGMNYDTGRGSNSFESITVTNGQGPPSLITSFQSSQTNVVSNQTVTLSWILDPAASGSIDNEIGNIDALTTNGEGSTEFLVPEVTEETTLEITLSGNLNGDTATRTVSLTVSPAPDANLDDFLDDFDDAFLNDTEWEHLGGKTYVVDSSLITWDAASGNWGHGEVASLKSYPIPEAGNTTTVIWVLGPATVDNNAANDENRAIRPMCGIFSAFEDHPWSRQHWQNDSGGLWLDITQMSSIRTDGVYGDLVTADDTKAFESNGTVTNNFDLLWNWETEGTTIELSLTDTGYTWSSGENELGTGTYADAGIDTEFSNGFKVMFSAISSEDGRGTIALDSIAVDNGGTAPGEGPLVISEVVYNADTSVTLTWNSQAGQNYKIETSTDLEIWIEQVDGVAADGPTREFTLPSSGGTRFYRVAKE